MRRCCCSVIVQILELASIGLGLKVIGLSINKGASEDSIAEGATVPGIGLLIRKGATAGVAFVDGHHGLCCSVKETSDT